jgi:pyruvate dehydrogenase E1 component
MARALDAMNDVCCQDVRFMLAAPQPGIALAPEGGAHQSIGTPLIGMAQPGLSSFEPAFVDALAVILRWALGHVQREGDAGGLVYLRLSTRSIEQPRRDIAPPIADDIVAGGYWLRPPGPNCSVAIAYAGAVAPEAIAAAGLLAEHRRDVGGLAVTSADRLFSGWRAAETARMGGVTPPHSQVERLLRALPRECRLVTVADTHPTSLGWLGSVEGHWVRALGLDRLGQSGSIPEVYGAYGLDSAAILRAAQAGSPGAPLPV